MFQQILGRGWLDGWDSSACWRLDESCYRWIVEHTHSRTKSTLNFYPVCVKSLRMNGLSVWCCRGPLSWLACARSSLGARPAESIFIMAQSWSRGWSATATSAQHYEDIAKQVLAPAQCPSALFEYLPHLSLNILGWFLCRKSSVSYRESDRRVRGLSLHTIHRF